MKKKNNLFIKTIVVINNEKYQVFNCPKCHQQMRYKMTNQARRFHGACSNCGKVFEVLVDKL